MYKVVGTPQSRAGRVIWLLEELGEPYEIVPAKPHDDEARACNPSGKVPALIEDDGSVLLDSVAICQYLADKHQQFTSKAGTLARARQDSFTQFAVDDLETPLWTAAKHSFVLPKEHRVREVKPACKWEFGRALLVLENRLGSGPYVMGEKFTLADLLLVNCVRWAKAAKFDPPPERIADYVAQISERPAAQRAIAIGVL